MVTMAHHFDERDSATPPLIRSKPITVRDFAATPLDDEGVGLANEMLLVPGPCGPSGSQGLGIFEATCRRRPKLRKTARGLPKRVGAENPFSVFLGFGASILCEIKGTSFDLLKGGCYATDDRGSLGYR
jgi:hypothetical protein